MNREINDCQQLHALFNQLSVFNPLSFEQLALDNPDWQLFSSLKEKVGSRMELFSVYKEFARRLLVQWSRDSEFGAAASFDKDGRVMIDASLVLRDIDRDYVPSLIKKITGKLDLEATKIQSLDYLEEVGSLSARRVKSLSSLRRLKKVQGDCLLRGTSISNLESLEFVKGDLVVSGLKNLKVIPRLNHVMGKLDLRNSGIEALPSLEVAAQLEADDASGLRKMDKLHAIPGRISIKNTSIKCLPNLYRCSILDARGTESLQSLPKLDTVMTNLILAGTSIKDLSSLKEVRKHLYLSKVDSLQVVPNLEDIGGGLFLDCAELIKMPALKKVNYLSIGAYPVDLFLDNFPSLETIYANDHGFSIVTKDEKTAAEFKKLKQHGTIPIQIIGEILLLELNES
jgi:hypothetical protein